MEKNHVRTLALSQLYQYDDKPAIGFKGMSRVVLILFNIYPPPIINYYVYLQNNRKTPTISTIYNLTKNKMKKIILFAIAAVISVAVSAKGLYLGGQAGFWHEDNDNLRVNTLTILPEIGYNINDRWAFGTELGFQMKRLCGESVTNIFEISPYVRYTYFRSSDNLVSLFLDGGAGAGIGWTSYRHQDDSDTACIWTVGIEPGVSLNFSKNVSIVAHLGLLGYQGANNAALDSGFERQGGILLDGTNLTLGFYVNF